MPTIVITATAPRSVVITDHRGPAGKSQYQSYVDTTSDSPPLSESAWIASQMALSNITTTGYTSGHMLRIASGGGLEGRTPAQVLSDIGGQAALTSYSTITALTGYPSTFPPTIGSGAGDAVAGNDSRLHAAATVSGNGISISGQQISLSIGTGATQVAAGDHTHTPLALGAASRFEPIRRIAFVGDSVTDYCALGSNTSLPVWSLYMQGFQTRLHQKCRARFDFITRPDGNLVWSYPSRTPSQILLEGRIGQALRYCTQRSDAVFLYHVGNGFSSVTGEQMAANIIAGWDVVLAAGTRCIGAEITPWENDTYAAKTAVANPILKAAAAARGMPFVEWHDLLDGNSDEDFPSGAGPHMSISAHLKMADAAYAVLEPLLSPFYLPNIVSANPGLTGFSGQTEPTTWDILKTASLTYANFSNVAASDGGNDWLETTLTSSTDAFSYFMLWQYQQAASVLWTPESPYTGTEQFTRFSMFSEMEVQTVSGLGILRAVQNRFSGLDSGGTILADSYTGRAANDTHMLTYELAATDMTNAAAQTPWMPIHTGGTWAKFSMYAGVVYLHPSSVVRWRMRNAGIAAM